MTRPSPSEPPKKLNAWLSLVMAVPFLGAGLFMGGELAKHVLYSRKVGAWPVTEARILDVKLATSQSKGGITYETKARYEYLWQGMRHENTRVGIETGSDNVGRTQLARFNLVREHFETNIPMPCRVNPDHPSEAILFPEIRPELALFILGLAVVFSGAGLGLMTVSFMRISGNKTVRDLLTAHPGQPWVARKTWRTSSILFAEAKKRWTLLGMTLIWNMFALGFLFLVSDGFSTLSMDIGSILVGLFVLIGIFLVGQTLLQYLRYQRFGPIRFDLDPFPGHIGGEVGGNIRIPKRLDPFVIPEAHLACYRLRVTGSGKNRRTVRDTLWSGQAERPAIRSWGSDGAIIPVRFQVPGDLPSASAKRLGDGDIVWELSLRMKVKGPDLVATFDIPVFSLK